MAAVSGDIVAPIIWGRAYVAVGPYKPALFLLPALLLSATSGLFFIAHCMAGESAEVKAAKQLRRKGREDHYKEAAFMEGLDQIVEIVSEDLMHKGWNIAHPETRKKVADCYVNSLPYAMGDARILYTKEQIDRTSKRIRSNSMTEMPPPILSDRWSDSEASTHR